MRVEALAVILVQGVVISEKRFSKESLTAFACDVFKSGGVRLHDAAQAADVLCTADEWGIRSHGLARLRSYHEMLKQGRINPLARPHIIKELPSMALIDGDNGLGLFVGVAANQIAMRKAKNTGIGWVNVINSNHYGIAGYYAAQGLSEGLIGLSMTNTPPLVSPFGGSGRKLGTNPIAAAFPTNLESPIIIDLATSAISLGSVENAAREGRALPENCIIDSLGNLSLNPDDLFQGGSLLPLGSGEAMAGHKGYCLASLVDLMCGVFPGAAWGPYVPPFLNDASMQNAEMGKGIGHLFLSISASAFEDLDAVRRRADEWIKTMRSTPPISGFSTVLVPGDPEHTAASYNSKNGISLDAFVQEDIQKLAQELDIVLS